MTNQTGRKIYVASSWRNIYQPSIVKELRGLGHEVYDFRHPHLGPGAGGDGFAWADIDPLWQEWSPRQWRAALSAQQAQEGFASDMAGMEWADTCVLVLPSGRSAHAEAGWMAGKNKAVFVYVPDATEPDLMHLMFEDILVTPEELLAAVGHAAMQVEPEVVKCMKCEGCGKVADTDDQEPWTAWTSLPLHSAMAVTSGMVKPITCPQCHGAGGVVKG